MISLCEIAHAVSFNLLFCLKKAFFLRSLVFSRISTTCVHFTCEEGGLVVSESNLLSIMSSHQKSKVNLGQVVPHYQCSKVSKLDSKLMQKRKGLLSENAFFFIVLSSNTFISKMFVKTRRTKQSFHYDAGQSS